MSPFKTKGVIVFSLYARDVPTTVRFYRDIVGLHLLPHHGLHPAFDLGNGSHLVIVEQRSIRDRTPASPRFPRLAFAVEDLDEAIVHLNTHGVTLSGGIEKGPDARWVTCEDPAGNLVEFAQMSNPAHP